MKRIASVVVWAVMLALLASNATGQGVVDFARPPVKGLKFKVVEKSREEGGTILKEDDKVLLSEIGKGRKEIVYTQTLTDVADGRITGVERKYGKCLTWMDRKGGKKVEAKEQKYPLSGVKVTWTTGSMLVEGYHGKTITRKKGRTQLRLFTPARLKSPFLPYPAFAVSVGDSWQLDETTLRDHFMSDFPGPLLSGGKGSRASWDFAFKLVRISRLDGEDCAVIECKGRISREEGAGPGQQRGRYSRHNLILDATYHYNLRHRIVVAMEYRSSYEGFHSSVRKEKTTSSERSGTVRRTARVTVLKERKTP